MGATVLRVHCVFSVFPKQVSSFSTQLSPFLLSSGVPILLDLSLDFGDLKQRKRGQGSGGQKDKRCGKLGEKEENGRADLGWTAEGEGQRLGLEGG